MSRCVSEWIHFSLKASCYTYNRYISAYMPLQLIIMQILSRTGQLLLTKTCVTHWYHPTEQNKTEHNRKMNKVHPENGQIALTTPNLLAGAYPHSQDAIFSLYPISIAFGSYSNIGIKMLHLDQSLPTLFNFVFSLQLHVVNIPIYHGTHLSDYKIL